MDFDIFSKGHLIMLLDLKIVVRPIPATGFSYKILSNSWKLINTKSVLKSGIDNLFPILSCEKIRQCISGCQPLCFSNTSCSTKYHKESIFEVRKRWLGKGLHDVFISEREVLDTHRSAFMEASGILS